MVQGETTIIVVRLCRYATQMHTFCSGLFRTIETTHSVGNNRTTDIPSTEQKRKKSKLAIITNVQHALRSRSIKERIKTQESRMQCNREPKTPTKRFLLGSTDLQILPWHVRVFDGFGKSLLVPSQDAGKEIAVSAFQGRERQFVGSVVIVYSVLFGNNCSDKSNNTSKTTTTTD
jgi:hypothetical protein